MSDPVLEAHELLPNFFLLNTVAPLSIRDQMVRAQWLVERMIEQGRYQYSSNDKSPEFSCDLMIIGAGAAGITAALTAVRQGLRVEVIEKETGPFSLQMRNASRWVDPTQYDWPAKSSGSPFLTLGSPPLPYVAAIANNLASTWKATLDHYINRYMGTFNVTYASMVARLGLGPALPSGPSFVVSIRSTPPKSITAPFIIWASGFGQEKCTIRVNNQGIWARAHRSSAFWDTDNLETPGYGLPQGIGNPGVLVLGGGDGAIQDALRALTQLPSAKHIFQTLFGNQPLSFERDVLEAEERVHRHWIWAGRNGERDHDINQALDDAHKKVVQDLLISDRNLSVRVRDLATYNSQVRNVRVIHRCNHLTCFYSLNRFLGHLFNQVLGDFFIPNLSADSIDVTGNDDYLVNPNHHPVCWKPKGVLAAKIPANLIVVRYGIDPSIAAPPWRIPGLKLQRQRHSLPHSLRPY